MEKKIDKPRKIKVTTLSLVKTAVLFRDADMPINLKFPYFKAKSRAFGSSPVFNSREPDGYINIDSVKYVKIASNTVLIKNIDFKRYEKLGYEVPTKINKSKKKPSMSYICVTMDLFKVAIHEITEGWVFPMNLSYTVQIAPYVESIQLLDGDKKLLTYCFNT